MLQLEPSLLWKHFEALSEIPRCSGNEASAAQYVIDTATRLGLRARSDKKGNVVVSKAGNGKNADAATVVLQAHLDMVGEKTRESAHDFATDPLRLNVRDGWVNADGTTLGADNGIGVAAALAILEDDSLIHPPIEFLATVEEEVGLKGAAHIDADFVTGRILLNLDGEEEGTILVGCAGGIDVSATRMCKCIPPVMADGRALHVKVSGLAGGHSGIDIHKRRGNAIKVLSHSLLSLQQDDESLSLLSFSGGTRSNALPRDAEAFLLVGAHLTDEAVQQWAAGETARWRKIIDAGDPGVLVQAQIAPKQGLVYTAESTRRFLELLTALPDGVAAIDAELGGMVETSSNLAVATANAGRAHVLVSIRSSRPGDLTLLAERVRATTRLFGMETASSDRYPPWPRDPDSPLVELALAVHKQVLGTDAIATTIHAGLECGILSERLSGLDAISVGPWIVNPHSPDEGVEVRSVERFFDLLKGLLTRLAQ